MGKTQELEVLARIPLPLVWIIPRYPSSFLYVALLTIMSYF